MRNLVLLVSCACVTCAFGYTTNVWTGAGNDWDWTDDRNFTLGKPNVGDIVQIPEGATVKLNASTDSGSLDVVNGLKQIWPVSTNSVLEVLVDDADEKSLTKPFTAFPFVNGYENGELRKVGGGILNLTSLNAANGSAVQDYWTHLHVVKGSLKMAKGVTGSAQLAKVTVESGAFFYPYSVGSDETPSDSKCSLWWQALFGSGTVTNDYPSTAAVYYLRPTGSAACEFSGRISPQFMIFTKGGCWNLTGVDSMTADQALVIQQNYGLGPEYGQGVLGVRKIGNKGEASSIGPNKHIINFRGYGACLRYLGEGETTTKGITWQNQSGYSLYWNFLDGGPFGGLNLAGAIQAYQNSKQTMAQIFERIMLTGSNVTECVVSGSVLTQTKPNDSNVGQPFFGKQGSGTWRFADTTDNAAKRDFGTPFVVEGGTLAFDSIAEVNQACALGFGNKLMEPFSGSESAGVAVDWFFALGRTNVTHALPVLDYRGTGTNDPSFVSTRQIELRGSGALANSSEKAFKIAGVWSAAGGDEPVKYLHLTGSADQTDTVADIADGSGKTGVAKDGAGKWTLSGDLTFTGPIEVNEGTLAVRHSNRYTWFWFQVCEVANNAERYRMTTETKGKSFGTGKTYQMGELGLFDASGTMISKNLFTTIDPPVSNHFNLAEGEISYDTRDYQKNYTTTGGASKWADRGIDKLFNGSFGATECARMQDRDGAITRDNTNSWNGLVFRLPAAVTNHVASWDFASVGGLDYTDFDRLVTTVNMKASVDGIRWETVTDKFDVDLAATGKFWVKDNATKVAPHNGFALPNGGRRAVPFSVTPKTVRVAKGATLVAEGDEPVKINGLIASTNGIGTIKGFVFAAGGVIDIPEVSKVDRGIQIEADFRDCDLTNLTGWTLKLNGQVKPNAAFVVTEDGIRILPRGLIMVVR